MDIKQRIKQDLAKLNEQSLYRKRNTIQFAQGSDVLIDGKNYLNFCNNDYLGLANSESLKITMHKAIDQYGVGAGSSQLICGHTTEHEQAEKNLASFLKRDKALIFTTGYQANLAIASTFINKETIVIQDKLNHASLIDSAMLSKGKLVRYAHNDIAQLETRLEQYKHKPLMVISDGVFSMDGDYARVGEMADLCKRYGALLFIDDAHGLGVLGHSGGGLLEQMELSQHEVPLLSGTFAKAFGTAGAFVAGDKFFIDALIQKARTYIYTTAIMPAIAATISKAIEIVSSGDTLRKQLSDRVAQFLQAMEGDTRLRSISHIQPLIIGSSQQALESSNRLFQDKILATAIRPPTVPTGTARIRLSFNATHTKQHIQTLVESLKSIEARVV